MDAGISNLGGRVTAVDRRDPAHLRRVFGAYPTGVTALAALVDGQPVGMAANSFTSVSLQPPLASVCIAHTSTTWPLLRAAGRLGVNVLSADQHHAGRQLSARTGDRFHGLSWRATDLGAILLDGASAWLECSVGQTIHAGDHDIVVLLVHELEADHDRKPLVFHASRFLRLHDGD
jgi:flavin reductase (DIM6/NTAB) family NADH-FMN oxidoreductase RutF